MAEQQGGAEIKLRKQCVFIAANSVVMGWLDDDGVRRGMTLTDWDAYAKVLSWDCESSTLGGAVRAALLASRIAMANEWADARLAAADYDARLAQAFGLKSQRGLYPGMKDVSAAWSLGKITLYPSRHGRGSAFGGFPEDQKAGHEDVDVPFAVSDRALGDAVRVCLARCL